MESSFQWKVNLIKTKCNINSTVQQAEQGMLDTSTLPYFRCNNISHWHFLRNGKAWGTNWKTVFTISLYRHTNVSHEFANIGTLWVCPYIAYKWNSYWHLAVLLCGAWTVLFLCFTDISEPPWGLHETLQHTAKAETRHGEMPERCPVLWQDVLPVPAFCSAALRVRGCRCSGQSPALTRPQHPWQAG